ncbi:neocarzinostatin apoprotein domain-containing protein [Glycomyces sp. NPDC047010]|uniref:neocarzinostatin apoprotein domain-containing protein n=1 Tax=Glycomyces sp. NPDC047010 TaxID=3155023 RepID=UPI0033E547CD
MAFRHDTRNPRYRRAVGWALGATAAAAMVLGAASPAGAATITTPGSPLSVVDDQNVTLTGTGTPGNYVAVAQCDFTTGGYNASDCNAAGSQYPIQIDANGNWSATVKVDDTFTNSSFSGLPPTQAASDCYADVCQIQVSEYTSWPPAGAPAGFDSIDLVF